MSRGTLDIMKNRDYKEFEKGNIVHIYNRGNNREKIFYDEQDYRAFLFRLGLALGFGSSELTHDLLFVPSSRIRITDSNRNNFKLYAFCLMPNHFHILIEQCRDISISKLMLKVCTSYATYINKKYKRVGHVFQDQFKAVLIENNSQLMWTSSYIHMNPVKDGIVKNPYQYKWSSYNDFVSERNLPIIYKQFFLDLFGSKDNFIKETFSLESNNLTSRGILDT